MLSLHCCIQMQLACGSKAIEHLVTHPEITILTSLRVLLMSTTVVIETLIGLKRNQLNELVYYATSMLDCLETVWTLCSCSNIRKTPITFLVLLLKFPLIWFIFRNSILAWEFESLHSLCPSLWKNIISRRGRRSRSRGTSKETWYCHDLSL